MFCIAKEGGGSESIILVQGHAYSGKCKLSTDDILNWDQLTYTTNAIASLTLALALVLSPQSTPKERSLHLKGLSINFPLQHILRSD